MKDQSGIFRLCDLIRETSFSLHQYLRHGHLERVYENGLAHRLRKAVLKVEQQYPLQVVDEYGTILGDFIADLYVENCLVVELKACKAIIGDHTAQLLGYLRASGIEHGLLINFGASKLEVKKYVLSNCI
ncbi:MAG: GxxExxY protein [Candidatus Scalindua sp.]